MSKEEGCKLHYGQVARGTRPSYLLSRFGQIGVVLFFFKQLQEILRSRLQLLGLRLLACVIRKNLCTSK